METKIWWLPPNISATGLEIDRLINGLHVFIVLLFVGWGIYLIYCLLRFRERPGHRAETRLQYFRLPKYLEMGILTLEVFLLVFVSFPIWAKVKRGFPLTHGSLLVRIVTEQFAWNVHYPGRDGKFGRSRPDLIDGTNPIGLDRSDPDAKDDIISVNALNVPVNTPIIAMLTSKDVIHSFNLPYMRVKQDAVPGMNIPVHFQATTAGDFDIACAQLCGIGHYRMRGAFNVMTREKYDAWLAEEEKLIEAK